MTKANQELELKLRRAARDLEDLADNIRTVQTFTTNMFYDIERIIEELKPYSPKR